MTKTYTALTTKNAGDAFTEAMWDTTIRDNINNFLVPPACVATRSAAQSISDSTSTSVLFDTEELDTDGMHSTAVNTERVGTPTAGIYFASVSGGYVPNDRGFRVLNLNHVSSFKVLNDYSEPSAGGGEGTNLQVDMIYPSTASDYFYASVYHETDAPPVSLDFATPRLMVVWLGKTS